MAGTGTDGSPTAGSATSSDLSNPNGVAVDSSGNLYIADRNNSVVEKVDAATGHLSVIAGNGTYGTPTAGPATSSNLSNPFGVAVDPSGNVYIADRFNSVVEKVDAVTGDLSVIAGTGTYGAPTAGAATSSNLFYPSGVAVDSSGNLYIADTFNGMVEKVDTATGDLSVIAGNGPKGAPTAGPATSSNLFYPSGVAVDSSGNVYIADTYNHVVEKVDAVTGDLSVIAGNGTNGTPTPGPATSSNLYYPYGVAVDPSGNVYIADTYNQVVEKVDAGTGDLSVIAGNGTNGTPTPGAATSSNLNYPQGVAVDSSGNLYIGDNANSVVEKLVPDAPPPPTYTLSVAAGTGNQGAPTPGSATSSNLANPYGVAADSSGNVYIADMANHVVEKVDAVTGDLSVIAGNGTYGAPTAGPATSSNLGSPTGVAVDSSGNLYIADRSNHVVEKVDAGTGLLSVIAGNGTYGAPTAGLATSSNLANPYGVALDTSGNLYIADPDNKVVEKVDAATGLLSVIAGNGTAGSPTPGSATSSNLQSPNGVGVDSSGNLYIADSGNSEVDKVDAVTGDLSVVAGTGSAGTPTPGPATSSKLIYPTGVAVDSSGNLYIADGGHSVVEMVQAGTGNLSIVAGSGFYGAPTAGPATSSDLAYLSGVAVDSSGNLYIADPYNNVVEKLVSGATTPVVITATGPSSSYVYGATIPSTFTPTYSGYGTGQGPTADAVCTSTASTGSAVGQYPVTCTGGDPSVAGDTAHTYSFDDVEGTVTITAAPVLITAHNQTKVYGDTDPTFTSTTSGLVAGDTLSTPATCTVPGKHSDVGNYAISCSGADAGGNYTITYPDGSLNVTAKPITVTATGASIVYGQPEPVGFTSTTQGLEPGDALTTPATCTVAGAHTKVGSYPITCASGSAGDNYTITYLDGTYTVAAKAGVVTADPKTITYGSPAPAFTYTVSGLQPGDALTTPPTCTVNGPHSAVGSYPIVCSGGDDSDYDLTYVPGTLTVAKKPVTITVTGSQNYGGTPVFTYTTASTAMSATAVTCSQVTAGNGTDITPTLPSNGSPYTLKPASCSGVVSPNYAASYDGGAFTVTKSTLSIADTSVFEGNHGATLRFPVTLSHPVAQDTTVHYATSNGTAVSGSDYRAASGTLTIPAGSMTGTVRVAVVSDKVREPNETLTVTLSSPDNATLARSSAVGTIRNDDTAVSIALRAATEDRVRVLVATGPVAPGASVTIYRVGRHGGLDRVAHTRLTSSGRLSIRLGTHYRDGTTLRFVAVVQTSHGLYSSRRAAITTW